MASVSDEDRERDLSEERLDKDSDSGSGSGSGSGAFVSERRLRRRGGGGSSNNSDCRSPSPLEEKSDNEDGEDDFGEERDTLPDLYDRGSEAGDTFSMSEGRSLSEERSITPDELDEIEEALREQPKPKVIVFDLDYTLWPFWVDRQMNIELPFKQVKQVESHHKVCDATGKEVKPFPDVLAIFQRLHSEGYKIAIASEAFYKEECGRLVEMFGFDEYVDYKEIYPGSKIFHFVKIKRQSGVDFCDMLYFDDEKEHLQEVAGTCTGITTVWADRGATEELLEEGLQMFANNRQSNTYFRSKPVTVSRRNSTEPFVSLRPLINLRRRNSVEADLTMPPPASILGGAGLAACANGLAGLNLHDRHERHEKRDRNSNHHGFNPNLPGLSPSNLPASLAGINPNLPGLNPNLPGLNGPLTTGGRQSKGRRRFSIM